MSSILFVRLLRAAACLGTSREYFTNAITHHFFSYESERDEREMMKEKWIFNQILSFCFVSVL